MIRYYKDKECEEICKGWGKEIILHNTESFCSKILKFNTGRKASLHFHLLKNEMFRCLSGKFKVKTINPIDAKITFYTLQTGDNVYIPKGHAHQLTCIKAGQLIECSTEDFSFDSYRIEAGDNQNNQ